MNFKQILELLKQAFQEFGRHKASRLAAALSYYTIFSIAPLLVISIAVAGLVFGKDAAQNQIVGQISGVVGSDAANLIQTMIQNVNKPGVGILATVIGFVVLMGGAAGVFGQIKGSLNTIWDIEPKPGPGGLKGILQSVRSELLSFLMVLGVGLLLLVSLLLSAILSALNSTVGGHVPIPSGVWELVNLVVSFGIITLLFAAIYKILPDADMVWRDVWVGAIITALLFTIGKWLIGLYLGHTTTASAYGAAGALVILLLWIYYSAQILFLGAEITQVYAHKHGSLFKQEAASQQPATSVVGNVPAKQSHGSVPAAAAHMPPSDIANTKAKRRVSVDTIEGALRIITPIVILLIRVIAVVNEGRAVSKKTKSRSV